MITASEGSFVEKNCARQNNEFGFFIPITINLELFLEIFNLFQRFIILIDFVFVNHEHVILSEDLSVPVML